MFYKSYVSLILCTILVHAVEAYKIFILVTQKEEPNPGSLICVDNYLTKDPFFFIHPTSVHCTEIMRKKVGVFELENLRIHIFLLDTAEMFQDGLRWSKVV